MPRSIAIIGGGIIGTCTAYYLSKHPKIADSTIRIFEGTSIAAGASGKAGGFLAADWHERRTASLGVLSFKLHEDLANEHGGVNKWGYRKVTTLNVEVNPVRRNKHVPDAEWLSSVSHSSKIGDTKTTGQVTPAAFTQTIAKAAEEKGVEITIATVTELRDGADGMKEVIAVANDGEKISFQATDVVFAAGPWTGRLAKQLLGDKAGVAANIVPSNCSTSVVLRPAEAAGMVSPHALFTSITMNNGMTGAPEVYPRADGTVYICGGASTTEPLPEKASDVKHTPALADKLREMAAFISPSHLGHGATTMEVAQACFRPNSDVTGAPIIGKLQPGIWIASGHQVWGIHNGPATGKVMAELILDGKATSAEISQLEP
ncbi:hypothetical protein FRB94_011028 [Tulasnella sp. JGI-2019a]|nr:hypothetical protein FRB94_011028 [Tulasnella sp. JGI-2019a]